MLFFNHPTPPSRKEVATQMVHQEATRVPELTIIVLEAKQAQRKSLQEKMVRPEPA